MSRIGGVLAAVPTPFDEAGKPDLNRFVEHCEWVLANGGDGLNVLGTTGEANSQGAAERRQVMHTASAAFGGRVPMMVGTGTPSLADTIELTLQASADGYDGALVLPPFYYKGVSDDGLFRYFDTVIRALGDGTTGVYLYNFPQMTGISFSAELVARLLDAHPERLCGMKDSSGDLGYTRRMATEFRGRFDVFPGSEAPLDEAQEYGYSGCISATVNATVKLAAKVWRQGGQAPASDVEAMQAMRGAIAAYPMVAAVKTLVAMRTGESAWRRVLPPLTELNAAGQDAIAELADKLGLTGTA